MKKCLVSIFLFALLFLSLTISVSAVNIDSVAVTDLDTFYSSVADNDVVHLRVNVSNINGTTNSVAVTADFVDLNVNCGGAGTSKVDLINSGGNVWETTCNVGDEAGAMSANTFKSGKVIVVANETYGPSNANTDLTLSLYNIGIPAPVGNCYRFGTGSTNFNDIINFNSINEITLILEVNDNAQCITPERSWGDNKWLKVAKLQFHNINFNNNAIDAQKLTNLSTIVKLKFSSSKTYQNTRLSVDTIQLPELDNNPFNVELYHLSLINPQNSFIVSDNNVQAEVVKWTLNGYESIFDEVTYNLSFTVNQGFKGFTITDNVLPTITLNSPSSGQTFNTSNILINATVNGTGTGVSKVLFYVNNVSNNAVCTVVTSEISNCLLLLNKNDGYYALVVSAYDYGNVSGNIANINRSFFVQTSAPTLTVKSPANDATYTGTSGSMLKINFSTSDGNGIGSCGYTLNGPVKLNNVLIKNCTGDIGVQLYLEDGDYDLFLYSKDTLDMMNSKNVSFTVSDVKAPVITNNTKLSNKKDITLSILTDEVAKCRYDDKDVSYEDMNDEFESDILAHTASVDLPAQGKIFTYYIRCSDLSDNVNKESFKIDLYYGDISNITAVPITNLTMPDPSETLELKILSSGKNTLMFDKKTNPVELISLVTNAQSTDVAIKIISASTPSVNYSEKIYKYFSIEHAALKDSRIEGANITFKVEKSWLSSNSINKSDILLARYSNSWIPLNTVMTREDNDYVYYTAVSPGLSLFAIYRQVAPEIVVPVVATNTTNNNVSVNNTVTSDNLDLLNKRSYNWWWVIILSIVIFVIIVLVVLIKRNDRKNPPIFSEDRTIFGKIRRLFR